MHCPTETSNRLISSLVGHPKVPNSSTRGCQIARAARYRRVVPAMENEANSFMIRGDKVLRSSSTPN